MGVMYIEGVVVGPTGKQAEARFLVNSGATYTLLPEKVWKAIELTPKRRLTFTLADGTDVQRDIFANALSSCLRGKGILR